MADLTEKQQLFVREYLIDLNATQAAIRAGYNLALCNDLKRYYVYLLVDSRNNEIFYVGKGKKKRCFDHQRQFYKTRSSNGSKCLIIDDILRSGASFNHYCFSDDLSESDALDLENDLIKAIGKDNLSNYSGGTISQKAHFQRMLNSLIPFHIWKEKTNPTPYAIEIYHKLKAELEYVIKYGYCDTISIRKSV